MRQRVTPVWNVTMYGVRARRAASMARTGTGV